MVAENNALNHFLDFFFFLLKNTLPKQDGKEKQPNVPIAQSKNKFNGIRRIQKKKKKKKKNKT